MLMDIHPNRISNLDEFSRLRQKAHGIVMLSELTDYTWCVDIFEVIVPTTEARTLCAPREMPDDFCKALELTPTCLAVLFENVVCVYNIDRDRLGRVTVEGSIVGAHWTAEHEMLIVGHEGGVSAFNQYADRIWTASTDLVREFDVQGDDVAIQEHNGKCRKFSIIPGEEMS